MNKSKEELAKTIDIAPWDLLRAHLERGGVVIVNRELNLADVAWSVAEDQKEIVERWLANSLISKPSIEQIKEWDDNKRKLFSIIVISPFVLVQEVD